MFEPAGVTLDELTRRGRKLVRKGGRQILLIASGGRVFAVGDLRETVTSKILSEAFELSLTVEERDARYTARLE